LTAGNALPQLESFVVQVEVHLLAHITPIN
jgi:hypothetical protein